jgi:cytoskeletal protein CcmA (bactofilin family)
MIFSQKRPKYGEDPNFVPNTVIGEGVTFRGHIKGVNAVMVSGLVFGDINVDGEVIVTETGYVEGNILSTFAVVAGIVEGDLILSSYAALKSTASVTGDITCTALNVEDGAIFAGKMNMLVNGGALAKKKRRISEQAAAMEAWQPRSPEDAIKALESREELEGSEEEDGVPGILNEDAPAAEAEKEKEQKQEQDKEQDDSEQDEHDILFEDIEDEHDDDWDSIKKQEDDHLEALLRDTEDKEQA